MVRILHVAGARPNFMKIAPLIAAFSRTDEVAQCLVHTGQHYDAALSDVFFNELGIPRPDVHLGIGSGSHAVQTARTMIEFEKICLDWKPDIVVVVGDVNSTVACSLVAAKLGIRVAHVEAGLRSFDRTMPEEINRVVTDHLSDLHFTTEASANVNLRKEGIPGRRIHFVGNVMIDTLRAHVERVRGLRVPARFDLETRQYGLVTLHRPSNVDRRESLLPIVEALAEIAEEIPLLFPLHPRTADRLDDFGLMEMMNRVRLLDPLGYVDFLGLMDGAALVITDSGGIQEETTVLGTPCLTVRPNTERPVTLSVGTNRLVPPEREAIVVAARSIVRAGAEGATARAEPELPELWDGSAAERIVEIVLRSCRSSRDAPEERDSAGSRSRPEAPGRRGARGNSAEPENDPAAESHDDRSAA